MFKLKIMKWYLIGAALGLLVGAIFYFVQPVKWQAQVLVKVGKNFNRFIEPMEDTIERILSVSFIQSVAERAKNEEIVWLLTPEKGAGLHLRQVRNGESIAIVVVGKSAELVRISLESIVAELQSRHEVMFNNSQADARKELSKLEHEIGILSKRLDATFDGKSVASVKSVEEKRMLAGFGAMAIQHDLEYKLNRSSLLRESIASATNRPTSLMESVSVIEKRIITSLWRACLFGVLLGILLSMLWVRWAIGAKRNKSKPEQNS